jgi:hypothetical protein
MVSRREIERRARQPYQLNRRNQFVRARNEPDGWAFIDAGRNMPSPQALQGDDRVIGDAQFVDRGAKPEPLSNALIMRSLMNQNGALPQHPCCAL